VGCGQRRAEKATLDRGWDGLIAHREFPTIGLANNRAARSARSTREAVRSSVITAAGSVRA
jgi:hypothetical protein